MALRARFMRVDKPKTCVMNSLARPPEGNRARVAQRSGRGGNDLIWRNEFARRRQNETRDKIAFSAIQLAGKFYRFLIARALAIINM